MKRFATAVATVALGFSWLLPNAGHAFAPDDVKPPIHMRFADAAAKEQPSFQRHVLPLMSRLGCNGRECHGSFQGRGGFQLSLFGYDFQTDHKALLNGGDEPRVNVDNPAESLIITKPTDENMHEGGERYSEGGWEHHVFLKWIQAGAKDDGDVEAVLQRLEVIPAEIVFQNENDTVQLRAIAHWSNGDQEDVTPLCRFQTNDDGVATVTTKGVVKSAGVGDTHVVAFYDNGITPVPTMLAVSKEVAANYPKIATRTKVDELVVDKLRKIGVVPAEVCSDEEFLRRVSLDMTGTLPLAEEVENFLKNNSPNKRAEKIDELLNSEGYAAWWATKMGDWTGNSAQNSGNNSFRNEESRHWFEWVRHRVRNNTPYDELIEGIVLASGRSEGQSYEEYCATMSQYYRASDPANFAEHENMPHYWSRRTVRQPEEKALSFAYAFMGVRIQCAQCHKHPFDQWSKQDFEQFTAFFGNVAYGVPRDDKDAEQAMKEDLGLGKLKGGELRRKLPDLLDEGKVVPFNEVYFNGRRTYFKREKSKDKKQKNRAGRVITPKLLGGEEVVAEQYGDPRYALMEWLADEDNPYFAKAFVNRVWAGYFNRGLIEPADDLSLANPASNEPLLKWLTEEFVARDYDMKWLHRTIVSSDTYQRSWQTNSTNQHDEKNFSRAVPRRLPAEVIYDAIRTATASDEKAAEFVSTIDDRAIGPKSGMQVNARSGYALLAFGKPLRIDNCDCERSTEPSLLQTLYLRNDAETLSMLESRGGWVDQVARQHNLKFSTAASNDNARRQVGALYKQLKALNDDISKVRTDGDEPKLAQLVKQRDKLKRKIAKLRGEDPSDSAGSVADAEKMVINEHGPGLVRNAYLRTLNRTPSQHELDRCIAHLHASETVASGLRDVLWALVNTKEFIVNH